MTGSMIRKSYKTKTGYFCAADFDKKLGGKFYFLIEPLIGCQEERFFYVRKLKDGAFEILGEGYIINAPGGLKRHISELKKELGSSPQIYYYHLDETGKVIKKEK